MCHVRLHDCEMTLHSDYVECIPCVKESNAKGQSRYTCREKGEARG